MRCLCLRRRVTYNVLDISNRQSLQKFITDVWSNHLVTIFNLCRVAYHLNVNVPFVNTLHISFNNTGFPGILKHCTYITLIINDGTYLCIRLTNFRNNANQSIAGNYVHINLNTIFLSFVNRKYMEPVITIAADNTRSNFRIIRIYLV